VCEGGLPYEVDPFSLATRGVEDFNLKGVLGFSAHFKIDRKERMLYNFGIAAPPKAALALFAITETGKVSVLNHVMISIKFTQSILASRRRAK
jgi:carotenoid cleavage dioxygenase-like enzyme